MKLHIEGTDKIYSLSLYNLYKIDIMPAFILIAESYGLISSLQRLTDAEGAPKYAVSSSDYTKLYYLVLKIQKYIELKAEGRL